MATPNGRRADRDGVEPASSDDEAYFDDQVEASVPEFWRRMGGVPDVAGLRVLELGCGHGAMALALSRAGARVTGVDLDADRIGYARERIQREAPELAHRIHFRLGDVADLPGHGDFDAVVSKDTFEHVADLAGVLGELRRLVRPGGRLYLGFSPLYHSPNGHHDRIGYRVPWAHAVLPRRLVVARAARHQGRPVSSLSDVGLNGCTPGDFRSAFARAGLSVVRMRYNAGDKRLLRVMDVVRRFPGLERYATVSIYAVLEAGRPSGEVPTTPS